MKKLAYKQYTKKDTVYCILFCVLFIKAINKEFLASVFWHGTCFIIDEYLCNTVLNNVAQVF